MPSLPHEPSGKLTLSNKTIGANETKGVVLLVVFSNGGYVDVSSSLDVAHIRGLSCNTIRREGSGLTSLFTTCQATFPGLSVSGVNMSVPGSTRFVTFRERFGEEVKGAPSSAANFLFAPSFFAPLSGSPASPVFLRVFVRFGFSSLPEKDMERGALLKRYGLWSNRTHSSPTLVHRAHGTDLSQLFFFSRHLMHLLGMTKSPVSSGPLRLTYMFRGDMSSPQFCQPSG